MLSQKKLLEYLLWFACSWNHDSLKGALSVSLNGWSMWFWMDSDSSAGLHIHSTCSQLPPITPISWFHFVDEFSLSGGNICSRQHLPEPEPTCFLSLSSRPAEPGRHNSWWVPGGQPALCPWCPGLLPGLGWASFLSHVMPEKWGSHLLPLRAGLSRNSS